MLLLAKALAGLVALLGPVTALLPASLLGLRELVAVLTVVVLCFATGLAMRTRLGHRMLRGFERRVLEKIPGFGVMRGAMRRVSGQSDDAMFQPVMVEIEEALTLAFIVEELDDGRCVVLVPSVPTPAAGSLYIPDARPSPLDRRPGHRGGRRDHALGRGHGKARQGDALSRSPTRS